ncbi:MAG: class I SAM-dependent methyltransferase [Leptospiraceae bacterium]|nr:class I SAM-dependent methyltransferase [Leptospiraceae bacterium]
MARKKRKILAFRANTIAPQPESAQPYSQFARVYDHCMEHVPYAGWADYLLDVSRRWFGRVPEQVLDLACGTGHLLQYLYRRVRHCAGMDLSIEMLHRARQRLPRVSWLQGRLEGPLPYEDSSQPWVVCSHDSINYLTDLGQLESHFQEVARILQPGGLYCTDIVSLNNILRNFDRQTTEDHLEGTVLVWSNAYNQEKRLMYSWLEFDRLDGSPIVREEHIQRFHTPDELGRCARNAGLHLFAHEGDFSRHVARKADNLWNFHFVKPDTNGRVVPGTHNIQQTKRPANPLDGAPEPGAQVRL